MLVPANQGSRPSLAYYAPLGLSDSELWALRQRLSAVIRPDNSRPGQPGLTPFAGMLRPVGDRMLWVQGSYKRNRGVREASHYAGTAFRGSSGLPFPTL